MATVIAGGLVFATLLTLLLTPSLLMIQANVTRRFRQRKAGSKKQSATTQQAPAPR
jgi:hypothetical protein